VSADKHYVRTRNGDHGPSAIARLFELANDLLATIDRAGRFTAVNPAWERVLGWSDEELLGSRAVDLLHPFDVERTLLLADAANTDLSDAVEFEARYRCKDGSYRWLLWNARLTDHTWYTVARDVTDSRMLEAEAARDPLTGLANRTAATQRLSWAVLRLERHPGLVGVLFVDLDDFKVINDGRGHELGDRYLCAAGARLAATVRGVDAVARFGGDEFVILIEDVTEIAQVTEVAGRVVEALKRPIALDHEQLAGKASVGVASTSDPRESPEALLREADIAMYQAKARGGDCYQVFDDGLRAEVAERVATARELRVAVKEARLVLHYQPIVRLPEASVGRCEALVRWVHPDRGLLAPEEFLPSAEESGLIVGIGAWVLEEACRQAREWRRAGRDIAINVNVSARQLEGRDFVDIVARVLKVSELPHAALCLEITETEIMKHVDRVAPRLEMLRRMGVHIAMDDFGSGYSSLTYLRSLPLDIIKVDKSFVADIATDRQDRAVVAGIVMLGRETDRDVVAEGVETEAQHAEVIALGCELAQGFLYDSPKPADELSLDGRLTLLPARVGDPRPFGQLTRRLGIAASARR
jgi:diguanylate cyclase (GGDEF)-like protein/PAS domain S-box-containing protein